jgi:uncharacterized protein YcnI
MQTRQLVRGTLLGVGAVLALAAPAGAHVTPSETSAPAGSYLKFDLRVPHGCGENGNTNKLEVQIPAGITSTTPQVVPGWTISITKAEVAPPLDDGHGGQITERTSVVTWTGGLLAHDQLEEFGLSVKLPDTPDETIYFPVIQTCDDGTTAEWIQIPEEGGEEPDRPAPAIALTEATDDEHGRPDDEQGDDEAAVDTTLAASTDDADDSSDGDGLAIAGLVVGALGLAAGGAALTRTRSRS